MPRVVFMCGPAGSGKSRVARRMESEGFTRLSFDKVAWDRGYRSMPLPEEAHQAIAGHLQYRLIELVQSGRDVVLDFSFWSRRMRDDWRSLLEPLAIVPETVYVATTRRTALARVQARAARDKDDFELTAGLAAGYFDHFEVPSSDEGPLTVIQE